MKKYFAVLLLALLPLFNFPTASIADEESIDNNAPIDLVFAVNTQSPADRVRTRNFVSSVIQGFSTAETAPDLRVGLVRYTGGKPTFEVFLLTDDFEKILNAILPVTEDAPAPEDGASEHVMEWIAQIILTAVREMDWTNGDNVFRTIYVVGGAHCAGDTLQHRAAVKAATDRGIIVNAAQLNSNEGPGIWPELARLGKGHYFPVSGMPPGYELEGAINGSTNRGGQGANSKYDKLFQAQLLAMMPQIFDTFIPYGDGGQRFLSFRLMMSINAALGGYYFYENLLFLVEMDKSSWELVDASRKAGFDLTQLPKSSLERKYHNFTAPQFAQYIMRMREGRARLMKQLGSLHVQRLRNKG